MLQEVWEYLSRKIKNIIIQKGEINVFLCIAHDKVMDVLK